MEVSPCICSWLHCFSVPCIYFEIRANNPWPPGCDIQHSLVVCARDDVQGKQQISVNLPMTRSTGTCRRDSQCVLKSTNFGWIFCFMEDGEKMQYEVDTLMCS